MTRGRELTGPERPIVFLRHMAWVVVVVCCASAGTGRAQWVLEDRILTAATWPVITLVIAPHGPGDETGRAGGSFPEVSLRERDRAEGPPDRVTRFRDASLPLEMVLLVDADRGMEPYFEDTRKALGTFARALARSLPRAVVHLVVFGADVAVYPSLSPAALVTEISGLSVQDRPGVRFGDAVCRALDRLRDRTSPRRRLLLFVGEGPLPDDLEAFSAQGTAGDSPPASAGRGAAGMGSSDPGRAVPGGVDVPAVCLDELAGLSIPAYVVAFSPTGWVGRDREAVAVFFRRFAGPSGMVDWVDVPLDSVRSPDFAAPFGTWIHAVAGALVVDYRIRAVPPASVRLWVALDGDRLPAAVDVTVMRDAEARLAWSGRDIGLTALLLFSFLATVLQWRRVQKMARHEQHGQPSI